MSSVLHPVGPREPRVYWVRRAVILLVVVVVVLVVAKECSGGGSTTAGHHKPSPTVTSSNSHSPNPNQVAACDPTTLTLGLSTDATSYPEGSPATLIGTFTNPGSAACTFSLAVSKETWTIKSGDVTVWTTKGCTTSTLVKAVTIKAGGSKKVTVTWDGHQLSSTGCTPGDAAQAGEYTVHAFLDGVKPSGVAVFHITSAT